MNTVVTPVTVSPLLPAAQADQPTEAERMDLSWVIGSFLEAFSSIDDDEPKQTVSCEDLEVAALALNTAITRGVLLCNICLAPDRLSPKIYWRYNHTEFSSLLRTISNLTFHLKDLLERLSLKHIELERETQRQTVHINQQDRAIHKFWGENLELKRKIRELEQQQKQETGEEVV